MYPSKYNSNWISLLVKATTCTAVPESELLPFFESCSKYHLLGIPLAVQGLRFCSSTAGGTGLIAGQRTKTPAFLTVTAKKKKKKSPTFVYKKVAKRFSGAFISLTHTRVYEGMDMLIRFTVVIISLCISKHHAAYPNQFLFLENSLLPKPFS